jgi:hypothetical protein
MKPTIRDNEAANIDTQLREAGGSGNAIGQCVVLSAPEDINGDGRVLFRPKPKVMGRGN